MIRNPQYNNAGTIDCEINHPVYGWIPFTASADDPEEHGRQIHAAIAEGQAGPIAAYSPPSAETLLQSERARMIVTRFQARAALHSAGLLQAVESIMSNEATDMIARLAWQDAQEFKRTSPTVQAMAAALGLTDAQVDDLFRQAATIEA